MDPRVRSVTPVLPVLDPVAALRWYEQVLGAENGWTWGDPVDTAGCMLGGAGLMFGFDPDLAPATKGLRFRFNVFDVRGFWAQIQSHGVQVLRPLVQQPWGSHEFVILDPNGFELVFGEFGATRQKADNPIQPTTEIRPMTAEEAKELFVSIGWAKPEDVIDKAPEYAFTVVALHENRVVGAASVAMGDANAVVVRDVMVRPDFQGMGIGSLLMTEVEKFLKKIPNRPHVFLATGSGLVPFYERFGFSTADGAVVSMCRHF